MFTINLLFTLQQIMLQPAHFHLLPLIFPDLPRLIMNGKIIIEVNPEMISTALSCSFFFTVKSFSSHLTNEGDAFFLIIELQILRQEDRLRTYGRPYG